MIRHLAFHSVSSPTPTDSAVPAATAASAIGTVCREAAKARFAFALRFVSALRPVDLQSFWYFPSKANLALIGSFGVLLWATAGVSSTGNGGDQDAPSSAKAADKAAQQLYEYRWALRVNAQMADFVAEGLSRVERLTTVIET